MTIKEQEYNVEKNATAFAFRNYFRQMFRYEHQISLTDMML